MRLFFFFLFLPLAAVLASCWQGAGGVLARSLAAVLAAGSQEGRRAMKIGECISEDVRVKMGLPVGNWMILGGAEMQPGAQQQAEVWQQKGWFTAVRLSVWDERHSQMWLALGRRVG